MWVLRKVGTDRLSVKGWVCWGLAERANSKHK